MNWKIIMAGTIDDLNESVMYWVNRYGYKTYGSAFWNGFVYYQTLVKYSN